MSKSIIRTFEHWNTRIFSFYQFFMKYQKQFHYQVQIQLLWKTLVVQASNNHFWTIKTKWLLLKDKRCTLLSKISCISCLFLMFQCYIIYTLTVEFYQSFGQKQSLFKDQHFWKTKVEDQQ